MPDTATPATFSRQTDSITPSDTQLYQKVKDTLTAIGAAPHHRPADDADLITAANATDLATSRTLTQAIFLALYDEAHFADVTMHDAADPIADPAAYTSAPGLPADLTEVQAALNEMKLDLNAHLASVTFHANGVGNAAIGLPVPVVTTADAIDQATANALANALKLMVNLHAKMGLPSVTDPV